nr:probable glutamate receptor [Onthophagus taurus]
MRLIQEFIKRHNATPVLKMLDEVNWGVQYDNTAEPTGLTAEVAHNNVDIVLGGFIYIYYSYHFLDFAQPHYNSLLKVMVPKPKLLSQLPLAFYPFPREIWIIIIIIYITSIITLFLASISPKYTNTKSKLWIFRLTILNVFGIYLQQPNYLYRVAMNYKAAMISTFGMSLFMSMVYNSRMSSLMIVPRYQKPIRKLDDFINSDLKVGTTSIKDYLLLVVNSDREVDQDVLKHFVEFNLDDLEKITVEGNIGRLTEITAFGNYALNGIEKYGLMKLQVMDDSICYYHLLLCTKKHFPLMRSFNEFIFRVVESGLTKYWENEAILFNSTITLQNIIKFSTRRDSSLRKLHLKQLAGAFIMLFIGLFLSMIAFIFERMNRLH